MDESHRDLPGEIVPCVSDNDRGLRAYKPARLCRCEIPDRRRQARITQAPRGQTAPLARPLAAGPG